MNGYEREEFPVVVVSGGHHFLACGLIQLLDRLTQGLELVHLPGTCDINGNEVGGIICVSRGEPQSLLSDVDFMRLVPPVQFLLSHCREESQDLVCSLKQDNSDRNRMWKDSVRMTNQKNKFKGRSGRR
ncbi:hypothetical protein K9M47_03975 [Candidatus Gracilibacteria bacterium]|nr:hypothetical protein [Candidatus Gracilibacteria bacterium]